MLNEKDYQAIELRKAELLEQRSKRLKETKEDFMNILAIVFSDIDREIANTQNKKWKISLHFNAIRVRGKIFRKEFKKEVIKYLDKNTNNNEVFKVKVLLSAGGPTDSMGLKFKIKRVK